MSIDLAKAKAGDKIRFKGGSSAILESAEFLHVDVDHGSVYAVAFQDGITAEFTRSGKPYSKVSYIWGDRPFGALDEKYEMTSIRTPQPTGNSLSISRAFNIASRRPGDNLSRHPALEFQTNNHLRGIAGRYKIPGNVTAPEYEDMMSQKVHAAIEALSDGKAKNFWDVLETTDPFDFLAKSWKKLVRLNPVLRKVRLDEGSAEEVYNAHLGVTSGFNVDDINFFLEQKRIGEGLPAKQAHEMPVHGERLDRIDAVAKTRVFWVASPATAHKVEERFKRRGLFKKPKPPAPRRFAQK